MKKHIAALLLASGQLVSMAQDLMFNGNFEDTSSVNQAGLTDSIFTGWSSSGFGAGMTESAAEGEFAAVVWNWYFYGRGYLVNGRSNWPESSGTPINYRPTKLTGQSKYDLGSVFSENDSAFIYVTLSKFNPTASQREVVGLGTKHFGPQADYASFEIEIDYTSEEMPDTVVVHIGSSVAGFCGDQSEGNCLYFYVDDLQLEETTTGLAERVTFESTSVFPNPTNDVVSISQQFPKAQMLQLISTDGRLVKEIFIRAERTQQIDLSDVAKGLYLLRWSESNKTTKLKIN